MVWQLLCTYTAYKTIITHILLECFENYKRVNTCKTDRRAIAYITGAQYILILRIFTCCLNILFLKINFDHNLHRIKCIMLSRNLGEFEKIFMPV